MSSINPSPYSSAPPPQPVYVAPPSGGGLKIPILFALVIALIGATVYMYVQLDHLRNDVDKTRDSLAEEIGKLRESSTVTTQSNRRTIENLTERLEQARRQAARQVGAAKVEATKHADDLAAKLAQEQLKQQQQVTAQFSQVQDQATQTNSKLGEVNTEVGHVKTDVAQAKSDLEKTISDLKRVNGELSSQGSLIATNGKELSALRQLGERNYVEFKLAKSKKPQKVGDIQLELKKTDPKRNKFTLEVLADDKRVEKKDRTINEPVQFLVSKATQPYEIVVNQVKKDMVVGYLAIPKVLNPR
ncbi:MAG TPA: hypothetical protein VKV15_26815 [Bryobacteraceae bacterium]|nr:hypothetical protein [Bryobacteraceae bacterium]